MNKRQREDMREAMTQNAERMRTAKAMKDHSARFSTMVEAAAEDAKRQMRAAALAGIPLQLRLCYLPATAKQDGRLCMVPAWTDAPEGFTPADSATLGGSVPYERYHGWIRDHAQRAPVLGPF